MQELLLLRHGAYNEGESILNHHGIEQVKSVIEYIRSSVSTLAVFSSSGPRAIQTATFIADEFNIKMQTVPWLDKNVDFERLDLESKVFESADSNQVVLVTSGEFIHQYLREFSTMNHVQNPLRPLVKGEVILCSLKKTDVFVKYF